MKKTVVCIALGLILCLCGCGKEVHYVTKYITNGSSVEFRQTPSNASTILYELSYGDSVSFESDVENGYSKVIHDGVTGYVLSTCLSAEMPETEHIEIPDPTPVPQQKEPADPYAYLRSNQNEDDIEAYITNFVRPLYNEINDNADMYTTKASGAATLWLDSNGCVKKELHQGEDNYNMSRQYYYDTNSGDMVFAFVFQGTQEHRLYFQDDKLVRYIDETGVIINNPTSEKALKMADHAIGEAY